MISRGFRDEINSVPSKNLRRTLLQLNFGFGYQIKLTDRKDLYFEPHLNYSINEIFESSGILNNSRLISFGLKAGVRF